MTEHQPLSANEIYHMPSVRESSDPSRVAKFFDADVSCSTYPDREDPRLKYQCVHDDPEDKYPADLGFLTMDGIPFGVCKTYGKYGRNREILVT